MTQLRAAMGYIAIGIFAVMLAACGGSHGSSAGSAQARASALATSPAVLHAESKLAPKIKDCGSKNGVALTVTGAGTSAMQVKVGHVKGTVMLHPVHTLEALAQCLGLTGQNLNKFKAFAKTTIKDNGFGKGSGTKDFTQLINYIAQLQS